MHNPINSFDFNYCPNPDDFQIVFSTQIYFQSFGCACMHAKSLQSCIVICNLMDYSLPGFSVMRFSRQEYWGGLPRLPPGDFPDLDIGPISCISCTVGRFLTREPPGKTEFWTHIFNSLVDKCGSSQAISLFNEEIKMIFFSMLLIEILFWCLWFFLIPLKMET